ncbi:MAG: malonyl-CoA decarboxylase, partial [Alphaproteobacteria bacterium]|nr:malonyl-CoA decarboxylase [Alphaproteobacteria bacterium]
ARAEDDASRARAEDGLRAALTPPRLGLFRQFAAAPAGVKSVVDLRADLARLVRRHPDWAAMENEVLGLLASWFDIGLLELRRMTWEAPAALLEKLIRYEAVHAIRSWDDLKNRLDSDRRCYAYFHPRMPDEPLIFVEVALVKGMADDVQALLDEAAPAADPRQADAAIFYSISNCQRGLAGVGFGEFLIKRVVDDLKRDFPRLDLFATLSPLPGFRAFAEPLLTEEDRAELARPEWIAEAAPVERLRPRLMGLAARYLLEAGPEGRARDRVAHFHLTNGARIERINFLADRSAHGLAQSYGVMVNYRYKLDDIAANHEAYRGEGRIGATGAVRALFKG